MKPASLALIAAGLVLGLLILMRGEAIALSLVSRTVAPRTLAALTAQIGPATHVVLPEQQGDGPFPVMILMHGCGGVRQSYTDWAERAAAMGFVAVVVDSNGPRGYTWDSVQDTVCNGRSLLGQERAGDILVGLQKARETGKANLDAVILAGWSHGAWTVMDFMTMGPADLPAGLTDYDEPWPNVRGVVLFYPYCSVGARSRVHSWKGEPLVLAMMGAKDQVVDTEACEVILGKMKLGGSPVEIVIYPEANHAFDHTARDPSKPWFRPDDAADAEARVTEFLAAQAAR